MSFRTRRGLLNSEDYRDLLGARDVLRRQLSIAKSDHNRLKQLRSFASQNPVEFVKRIRSRTIPDIPIRQRVHYVPHVDFTKYAPGAQGPAPVLRGLSPRSRSPSVPDPEVVKPGDVVRGRAFSASKPKTFNQLWTEEEHGRLVTLLTVYPKEAVAAHRWAKIARALGNRTPKQVASRTQKYFNKLRRMGQPLPGTEEAKEAAPTLFKFAKEKEEKDKTAKEKVERKQKAASPAQSGPAQNGKEEEREAGPATVPPPALPTVYRPPPMSMDTDEEVISQVNPDMKDSATYKELLRLQAMREVTMAANETPITEQERVEHIGFACDKCGAEPIRGVRWHCDDCMPGKEVDLCGTCKESGFVTQDHVAGHGMRAVLQAERAYYQDSDYLNFSSKLEANYLDPNFLPV